MCAPISLSFQSHTELEWFDEMKDVTEGGKEEEGEEEMVVEGQTVMHMTKDKR